MRRTRLTVELMEDRLAPSWGAVPPSNITPSSPALVRLDVAGDATGSAAVSANEIDWFKLVAPKAGTYKVATDTADSGLDTVLAVYNSSGRRIAHSDDVNDTDKSSALQVDLTAGNTYFIGITNYTGTSGGSYIWSVDGPSLEDRYEDNDMLAEAADLGAVSGRSAATGLGLLDEADWFKFTTGAKGASGQAVSINFINRLGNLDLKLYNAAGTLLGQSTTSYNTEKVSLAGRPAGTYYLHVLGRGGASNTNYSLTISAPTASSTIAPAPAPSPAPVGTPVRGLAVELATDGSLSRTDMLQIFALVEADGTVSATEFTDLKAVVSNTTAYPMSDVVRVLSRKVVLGNPANAHYQGATLGNLAAGNSAAKLQKLVNKWFLGLDRPAADGTYTYALGTHFGSGPEYRQIEQGDVGDCYLLAGLGSVALHTPTTIETMFTDNGDGTFVVRFYRGSTPDYVTVDRYLPTSGGRFVYANMGDLASNSDNVLWVALAEKAYAQWNESGIGRSVSANSYSSIEAGEPSDTIAQITGQSAYFSWTSGMSFSTIRSRFDANQNVTFGTRGWVASNLVPGHAYIMVDYDAAKQTVTLFNPWGVEGGYYNGSQRSGFVTLTMSQLLKNFDACWYS